MALDRWGATSMCIQMLHCPRSPQTLFISAQGLLIVCRWDQNPSPWPWQIEGIVDGSLPSVGDSVEARCYLTPTLETPFSK